MGVTEIVRVQGKQGAGDGLAATFDTAVQLLLDHPECHGVKLLRGVEDPDSFVLQVQWTSVEAHESWRATDARTTWREALAEFQAQPNEVAHFTVVLERP